MNEEAVYITDDRDLPAEDQDELAIFHGGNGDWYVQVRPKGRKTHRGVRLCTSGGASSAVPGLTNAIAEAYRSVLAAQGKIALTGLATLSRDALEAEVEAWRRAYPERECDRFGDIVDRSDDAGSD